MLLFGVSFIFYFLSNITEYQVCGLLCDSNKQSGQDCVSNLSMKPCWLLDWTASPKGPMINKSRKECNVEHFWGGKCPFKSVAQAVNHLVTNGMVLCPVSNTGEQKTTSGDQWHDIVPHKYKDRVSPGNRKQELLSFIS